MKTKDLMLGDWVNYIGAYKDDSGKIIKLWESPVPIKVIFITPDAVQYEDEEGCYECLDYELHPIPLTTEILEKNGFKIDKNETYCKRYFFACNLGKTPQTVVEFSFYGEGVSADTLFKCWTKPESCDGENSIHICDLKFVHQLQQALRLCGIEHEITL